jgi:hypothetical protein
MHTFPSTCGVHASNVLTVFPFNPCCSLPTATHMVKSWSRIMKTLKTWILGWRAPSRRSCARDGAYSDDRIMMCIFCLDPLSFCNHINVVMIYVVILYWWFHHAWIWFQACIKGTFGLSFKNRVWQHFPFSLLKTKGDRFENALHHR